MITKYLLILGIGHLLGDFYLQGERISRYKDEKYWGVVIHSLQYYFAVILSTLLVFDRDMILAATYAALLHFVIDTVKYVLLAAKKIRKSGRTFVFDQCAHIISLLVLAYSMEYWNFSIGYLKVVNDIFNKFNYDAELLARWVLAILLVHMPANIFIQNFLGDYKPKDDKTIIRADNRVGRKIGTIERLIMLIFLSINQYTAIGFVLTAKSIARYDKITHDEKFAEYYLLGTLISTLYVLICRMLVLV